MNTNSGKDSATREFLLTHNKALNTQISRPPPLLNTSSDGDLSKILF